MMIDLEGLLPIMLLDPLVTWSCKATWDIRPGLSLLQQDL